MRKQKNRIVNIVLILFVLAAFVFVCLFKVVFVEGESMMPTLNNGTVVVVCKLNKEYEKNDLVIFQKNNKTMIKRVIGVEGDTIEIRNNKLFRNGVNQNISSINKCGVIKLEHNQYFVVGDNFQNSFDSRDFGYISFNEITGKVME